MIEYTTEQILNSARDEIRSTPTRDSLDIAAYMRSSDHGSVDDCRRDDSVDELEAGKIFFRLEYDFGTKDLIVSVVECRGLVGKRDGCSVDPYVRVAILPDRRVEHQTKAHKKTLNPRYDETVVFHGLDFSRIGTYSVCFEVFDYRKFAVDDKIGHLEIPLDKIDLRETKELWQHFNASGEDVSLHLICLVRRGDGSFMHNLDSRERKFRNILPPF